MKTRRKLVIAYGGAIVLLLAASALHPAGLRKHHALSADVARISAENEQLREKNQRLRREARALAGDPAALERAAREELGYVRPGERIYDLAPSGGSR